MPDWKKIVREKLGTLPLTNGRRDEVIEELAQQLESAYEEALAQGITEQEALARSLAQFKNWDELRAELFHSVEGTRLPVWEQNGIFSPRRWPVWTTLALALLLFVASAFRQGLAVLPFPGNYPTSWSSRTFSDAALRRIEQSGDTQKYARTLAFVALHSPKDDDLRTMQAAEKAIALDPQLTWISAKVSHASYLVPGYDPRPWIERLKAWDPQNAFPYLLEASANVHSEWATRWAKYSAATPELRKALAAEPRWRIPMDKAFTAPRFDLYEAQRFALDRQVLQEQGFDRPDMLLAADWSRPFPDLLSTNLYANIQLNDVGENAEKSGRSDEALAAYETVARFGERIQADSSALMRLFSAKYRTEAYEKMLPILRKQERNSEAASLESALAFLPSLRERPPAPAGPFLEAASRRSAQVVLISGIFVVVLSVSSALWLTFLVALKRNLGGSRILNRIASSLCLAPPALLLASMVFFLAYYPYARSLSQFNSAADLANGYGPFLMGLYDVIKLGPLLDVWIDRMFWPLIWCAAIALAGACLLWWMRSRTRPDHLDAA